MWNIALTDPVGRPNSVRITDNFLIRLHLPGSLFLSRTRDGASYTMAGMYRASDAVLQPLRCDLGRDIRPLW